jgi:hypothetical protein
MDCVAVRGRLTEYVLSALPGDEQAFVERHLDWCAACRKEATELEHAVGAIGFTAPQADPPVQLEGRVVRRLQTLGGTRGPWRRRLRVLSVATAAAVLVAVLGVGWGAAMFAKQQTDQQKAKFAETRVKALTDRLEDVLSRFLGHRGGTGPQEEVLDGQLAPYGRGTGGAGAILLLSPTREDWALVAVGGVPKKGVPYHVTLQDRYGAVLSVGTIRKLDSQGSGFVWREFGTNLKRYVYVLVRDRSGRIVLTGTIEPNPTATATAS